MKKLKDLFASSRKYFPKDGKLKKLEPLFNAVESFFFIPNIPSKKGPHVRDNLDVKRLMSFVILALIPPLMWGMYNVGYQSNRALGLSFNFFDTFEKGFWVVIPIIIVSYAVGFFWEVLFAVVRRHQISEGFLVTGLLFPMTLPPTISLWQVAIGISFGVVIGKEIFGGTGRNFLNPALTGRAFLFFAYPSRMSGDSVWTFIETTKSTLVDAVTSATPLAVSASASVNQVETVLEKSNYTFIKLFLGVHPGSIGETSILMCLIGAFILVCVGVASYRTMIGGFLGVLVTGFILNLFAHNSSIPGLSINPFYHLIMGGFAFGIVYMATDPVSSPSVESVKWIYGFLIGALTVLIRVFNSAYSEGVMLAILFMNVYSPLLDHIATKIIIRKRVPNV
ncbi:MAG: NADH:ubiquinone reductase (Na(+)-transporting) subunit B [Desulfobacterales bacterium]|nr:NADH:ubiquinone reductase (Na(+)-transporting) subunit B [Desulfobacterales bacterium]